jgi:hypothetical protein
MTRAGDDAERSDEEERRMTRAGDDAERSDEEERRMTIDPAHIRAQIDELLAELPGIPADGANQLDTQLVRGDIDEVARRLSEAHDVLVKALESAEKG